MLGKDILRQVVLQQKGWLARKEKTVKREVLGDVLRWFGDDRILILTGLRRSGKSTLLRQLMRGKPGFAYINFEDERLLGFEAKGFESLNEVLVEVYGNPRTYYFDEVQNVPGFELFLRRLQDQKKKVIITGSNASLLSSELGTRLTGRYKSFEVYPFSFAEFLSLRGAVPDGNAYYITEKKVSLLKLFDEYLVNGGLPEFLKNSDPDYVKTLYENILYRDIISRYSIKKQKVMKELVNVLMTNVACQFTYNSLKNDLGLSNAITVKEYISYLSNSFLFFELQRFDYSIRKQLNYPKKAYIVDPAFNQIAGFNFSANRGRLLENFVFLELKRRGLDAYYYSGKNECDFVIKSGNRIAEALQVCHTVDDGNREREINGLVEAAGKFGLKNGLILTHEQEEETKVGNVNIRIVPAFNWALERKY
jgi:predicted AAA+ superfamily ATPase